MKKYLFTLTNNLDFVLIILMLYLLVTNVTPKVIYSQTRDASQIPLAPVSSGCNFSQTVTGTVQLSYTVPVTATYTFWARMMPPDSTNNAFWAAVDNGCPVRVGNYANGLPANIWTWVNYTRTNSINTQITLQLDAGSHVVTLYGTEPGVKVDAILFVSGNCVPEGTGGNCAVSATATPAVSYPTPIPTENIQPTEVPGAAVTPGEVLDTVAPSIRINSPHDKSMQKTASELTIRAVASDNIGVAKVEFLVNGQQACVTASKPFHCKVTLHNQAGSVIVLTARAFDTIGNSASHSISVVVE